MTIIDFYKRLSTLLTDSRENFLSKSQSEKKLEDLLEEAKKNKANLNHQDIKKRTPLHHICLSANY